MSTPTELPPSTEIITLTRCVSSSVSSRSYLDSRPPLLHSHVLSEQIHLGVAASGDLTLLLNAIQLTSKFIATNVRRARLINL
jgi:hypothetical protein